MDGRLAMGDKLLVVNGVSMAGLTHQGAVEALQGACVRLPLPSSPTPPPGSFCPLPPFSNRPAGIMCLACVDPPPPHPPTTIKHSTQRIKMCSHYFAVAQPIPRACGSLCPASRRASRKQVLAFPPSRRSCCKSRPRRQEPTRASCCTLRLQIPSRRRLQARKLRCMGHCSKDFTNPHEPQKSGATHPPCCNSVEFPLPPACL